MAHNAGRTFRWDSLIMAKTSFTLQEENVYLELKESDRFVLGIDGTVDGRGFCFLGATKEELERIANK